ncbi:hypothetical protein [Gluconobacter albidus]|uniref:hypothetical protein n=1 Tax=Gluconobacter albidus TaxID=318683 RepID=UPI0030A1EDFC
MSTVDSYNTTFSPTSTGDLNTSATGQNLSMETAQEMEQALIQLLQEMEASGNASGTGSSETGSSTPTPVGNTGLSLTGNLSDDMKTLKTLVDMNGTNGNTLQQYAQAVSSEASQQGNGLDSSVAGNIGRSLSDGTYDQGGSSNAIKQALQGNSVDALSNNVGTIADALQSGKSGSDEFNNLNALAREASNAGNSNLADVAKMLASEIQSGTFNSSSAASELKSALG